MTRHPRTTRLSAIDDATASEIRALLALAEDADGVEAVSESFRLAIGPAREGVVHLLRLDEDDAVVGYAQVAQAGGPDAVAELVVDPRHRRRGHGRALLDEVVALGARSVWAHGMLPAATALAAAAGLVVTRELYVMSRPLTAEDAVDPVLPQGFSVRPFEPGVDDEHWAALNAAAFASHPEQGQMSRADFDALTREPWFAADDLRLAYATSGERQGELAGFTWVKTVQEGNTTETELYVLGVDPTFAGIGLGAALLGETLRQMATHRPNRITLYVDGDNTNAVALYARAGVGVEQRSMQYLRAATLPR